VYVLMCFSQIKGLTCWHCAGVLVLLYLLSLFACVLGLVLCADVLARACSVYEMMLGW